MEGRFLGVSLMLGALLPATGFAIEQDNLGATTAKEMPQVTRTLPAPDLLTQIQARGVLRCGVGMQVDGFVAQDSQQKWVGLEADFCRAMAAAIFADQTKVEFLPRTVADRFEGLRKKEIDVLIGNTSVTLERELREGVRFPGVLYYDGQGFLVSKSSGIRKLSDLANKTVCVLKNTTAERQITQYAELQRMPIIIESFSENAQMMQAYQNGRCMAVTAGVASLAAYRKHLSSATQHVIVGQLIAKDAIGPVIATEETRLFDVARAVGSVLLNAEEERLSSETVVHPNTAHQEWLKEVDTLAAPLGLPGNWAATVLAQVGNYNEVYERNLGGSSLVLKRNINLLWREGGIHYAPRLF